MRALLLAVVAAILGPYAAFASESLYTAPKPLVRVHAAFQGARAVDGDTFKWRTTTYRMLGMDAPEDRTKCVLEKAAGLKAKARLQHYLDGDLGAPVLYRSVTRDKYGRRLAKIKVKRQDVAKAMIAENYARAYDGGKRPPWPGCGFTPSGN